MAPHLDCVWIFREPTRAFCSPHSHLAVLSSRCCWTQSVRFCWLFGDRAAGPNQTKKRRKKKTKKVIPKKGLPTSSSICSTTSDRQATLVVAVADIIDYPRWFIFCLFLCHRKYCIKRNEWLFELAVGSRANRLGLLFPLAFNTKKWMANRFLLFFCLLFFVLNARALAILLNVDAVRFPKSFEWKLIT